MDCVSHLIGLVRREDDADRRLGAAFEHVIAFLIEGSHDGVLIIECHDKAGQRSGVVASVFAEAGIGGHPQLRKPVDLLYALNPAAELSLLVLCQETSRMAAVTAVIVALQRPLNTLGQRLLDVGKLILLAVLFVVFGVLAHSLFVLEGIIVVVDPHDAVKRIGEGPVEGAAESCLLRFKGFYCRTDLEISCRAALDGNGQPALAEKHIRAVPFCDIAHREVILDVVLEEVPAFLADSLHDRPLSEDNGASFRAPPEIRTCHPFADERRTEVVKQFGAKFMAISRGDGAEIGQRLDKARR